MRWKKRRKQRMSDELRPPATSSSAALVRAPFPFRATFRAGRLYEYRVSVAKLLDASYENRGGFLVRGFYLICAAAFVVWLGLVVAHPMDVVLWVSGLACIAIVLWQTLTVVIPMTNARPPAQRCGRDKPAWASYSGTVYEVRRNDVVMKIPSQRIVRVHAVLGVACISLVNGAEVYVPSSLVPPSMVGVRAKRQASRS
jgi:hypothetical protein